MPAQARTSEKYFTPLRQAQRDLTRSRIKNAARHLFYEHHYDATTMDEIAVAAGLRRSTLYLHYKDKAEILADVIADYTPRARGKFSTLPGPKPTLQQLQRWIGRVASFVADERVSRSIIMELRRNSAYASVLENLTSELLAGLGTRNPPFQEAAKPGADSKLRAKALMLLQELIYACEVYLDAPANPVGKGLLRVTADDFHAFLSQG